MVATVLVFVAGYFWYDAQQQKVKAFENLKEARKQRDKANAALKGFYETQIFDAENIKKILATDKNQKGVDKETAKVDSLNNLIKALE